MITLLEEPHNETPSIHYIISNYFDKTSHIKLDLDPLYQREIVWLENKQIDLIDSLMKNYPIQSIIINNDTQNNIHICMDGKQRLTSIKKFYNNEIYWINNEEHDIHVYFSKIKKNDKNARIMSSEEKNRFLQRQLQLTKYKNLPYEIQAEIFHRIQKGEYIHYSDLIVSYFKNKEICKEFKKGELKIFKKITLYENQRIAFILEKDYFRMFIINCIHFIKNPWTICHKNTHRLFIEKLTQPEVRDILKDLFNILSVTQILNNIHLPKDHNILIPIIFISNKYKKIKIYKLEESINTIKDKYKNEFNMNEDMSTLTNKLIHLKNDFTHLLGNINIKFNLDKKTIKELHEIMKKIYIPEVSKFQKKPLKVKRLMLYHANFGLDI